MTPILATITLFLIGAVPQKEPLAAKDLLDKMAEISKSYQYTTEWFTVDKRGAGKAESMAALDLQLTKHWSEVILKPGIFKELDRGGWIAYKDISHRIEPIVATAGIGDSLVIWSADDRAGALLVISANKTVFDSEEAAKDLAMEHLMQYFKVPKFTKEECKFYVKEHDGMWAGYVNYGLVDPATGKNKKLGEWYHSVLFISDGKFTIVQMPFEQSGVYAKARVSRGSSRVPIPKTKSRFEE